MGEGETIEVHPCRRKPRGVFVGRRGDGWALIRQRSPFTLSVPGAKGGGPDGLSVLFDGCVLADGFSYCPYCGASLPQPSKPAGCYVLKGRDAEPVAEDAGGYWETLSEGGGE